nr:reverse transcriptase domain-containing protein [Tanacetum cinerariifolium]
MTFSIDYAMKQSYSNDDTCFSIDVIDEILEEDFDALLDEGSKILYSFERTLLEDKIFFKFDEFMAMTIEENFESYSNKEEITFEKITFNTDYKIKKSLDEPPTDLELKLLLDHLEYTFLEEPSFLPIANMHLWKVAGALHKPKRIRLRVEVIDKLYYKDISRKNTFKSRDPWEHSRLEEYDPIITRDVLRLRKEAPGPPTCDRTEISSMGESQVAAAAETIKKDEMKPWEQHSSVISLPRYDYKAPSSFLTRSFSGFLVTCPIKREKSATKEVISILNKYIGSINTCISEGEKDPQSVDPKRRKIAVGEIQECVNDIEHKIPDENNAAARGFVHLEELRVLANSTKLPEQFLVYFDMQKQREAQLANELSNLMIQLLESVNERRPFIEELEHLLGNLVAYKMREELKHLQKDGLIKVMELRKVVLQLRL